MNIFDNKGFQGVIAGICLTGATYYAMLNLWLVAGFLLILGVFTMFAAMRGKR